MKRYYMFNKPRGYITAVSDERHKTVMDCIDTEEAEGLFPVGRLDKDTEGFLILTDDGDFCFHVTDPKYLVEKTYFFYATGTLTDEKLKRLESGVDIGMASGDYTSPAKAEFVATATYREISHLIDIDPARLKYTKKGDVPVTAIKLTITEGKKHQVKRMLRYAGARVIYLKRLSMAALTLDESLEKGSHRPLTENELEALIASVAHLAK